MSVSSFAVPSMIFLIISYGLYKKVNIYSAFLEGTKDGIATIANIIGPMIGIFIAVNMFKASGALDILIKAISPVANFIKFPSELLPFSLVRPISGSGSLAMATDLFKTYGTDSFIGRCASVIMGSSETTFYALTVYFGAIGIKNTRHTLKCALLSDAFALFLSILICRNFFN
ncbi:MAG: spore maturation protein [Ruminococcaceae bacterium]|nr:spore maturation protein [Oscillospiraceae bacterium]